MNFKSLSRRGKTRRQDAVWPENVKKCAIISMCRLRFVAVILVRSLSMKNRKRLAADVIPLLPHMPAAFMT